jgi:hypothetical protein
MELVGRFSIDNGGGGVIIITTLFSVQTKQCCYKDCVVILASLIGLIPATVGQSVSLVFWSYAGRISAGEPSWLKISWF